MKFLTLSALVAALAFAGPAPAADATKPNIVFILMDDMGYGDIAPFNSETKNRTPNLDRMAREGMKLTSFYAAPVCTPSRAQILTGCYAKRVSLPQVILPAAPIGLNARRSTPSPALLKEQGYATMCIGKWHVGDQPEFLPATTASTTTSACPTRTTWAASGTAPTTRRRGKRMPPLPLVRDEKVIETLKPADQDRLTERYTDEAVKLHPRPQGRAVLPLPGAHGGPRAAASRGEVPRQVGQRHLRRLGGGSPTPASAACWIRCASCSWTGNTLVIFTSDNGPWLIQGKNGGDRRPAARRQGRHLRGRRARADHRLVAGHISAGQSRLTPSPATSTCCRRSFTWPAGPCRTTARSTGRIFRRFLLGKTKESPRPAHFYFNGNQAEGGALRPVEAGGRAAEGEHRQAEEPKQIGPFTPKLYNLDDDIGETTDVAEKHPDVVKRLEQFVSQMDADLGAKGKGPGVRPPGRVEMPRPLLLK